MNCIIVDDEPLAREAMKLLIEESSNLQLIGSFNSASTASDFMEQHVTDLVFLDIQGLQELSLHVRFQRKHWSFSLQPIQSMHWTVTKWMR